MADVMHIDRLYEGVEAWNEWRRQNPSEKPSLVGEDLSEMDLTSVNLSEADLTDAELIHADLTEATRTIQAETLILCGEEDSATPPAVTKRLADLIPNARYAEIADAGHLPCIEQPRETAVHIEQFL